MELGQLLNQGKAGEKDQGISPARPGPPLGTIQSSLHLILGKSVKSNTYII